MNKQRDRYTPFTGKYKMPVDEFCLRYGLSLKVVMHRMNVLYWEDYDSLVIPQEVGDTSADRIVRILKLIDMEWSDESIMKRMDIDLNTLTYIKGMDEYKKDMFRTKMKNYFYLDPAKIDLDHVFVEQEVA